MAETAKILNPGKKVLLPDLEAGCSLADSCPAEDFGTFKALYPDHKVVSYINCTAEVKALSDIICTSSNAISIVKSFPKDQPLIFAPDKNLGRFVAKESGRDLLLWDGACIVHESFSMDEILKLVKKFPQAKIIAHPESKQDVLNIAHFVGSTSKLLAFVRESNAPEFIVATETGILHQMKKENPTKVFVAAPVDAKDNCSCQECPYMKMNTMEKLYLCLKDESPEIQLSDQLIKEAHSPIEKMLALS
jgi:quinolinate synthase